MFARLNFQRRVSAGHGVLRLSSGEEEVASLQLNVKVIRKQVRGSDKLIERAASIADAQVGFAELLSRGPKPGINLNGVAELDDRGGIVGLFEIAITAFEVLLLPD